MAIVKIYIWMWMNVVEKTCYDKSGEKGVWNHMKINKYTLCKGKYITINKFIMEIGTHKIGRGKEKRKNRTVS